MDFDWLDAPFDLRRVRLDPRMLARLKRLARSRYLHHESTVKQWLGERLEKET